MTIAEVRLWGQRIGAVSLRQGERCADFQYDGSFIRSGIRVAPLMMPLESRVFRFPGLPFESFHGLPGLLADALPDKFGNAVIDAWLANQGRSPGNFNSVERLCYTGARGMGALEFAPAFGPAMGTAETLQVSELVRVASQILQQRKDMRLNFQESQQAEALKTILRVGTSAGGARAKAVIAWNPDTEEIRSGQIDAGDGFQYWLLKFDGVAANKDKELNDPRGYGTIEYAYSLMARAAGIDVPETRLLQENGRHHFMVRRFDREGGRKLHMQSLAALAHYDFNAAGVHSYEQAFLVIRKLNLGMTAIEEQFRRMVFNVAARNQDDHVKNIAFLMNREGEWRLSPAFDITYAYNPAGVWTSSHQMSINNKRDNFEFADLQACARKCSMGRNRAKEILEEVNDAVSNWRSFAEKAGVDEVWSASIENNFRFIR